MGAMPALRLSFIIARVMSVIAQEECNSNGYRRVMVRNNEKLFADDWKLIGD